MSRYVAYEDPGKIACVVPKVPYKTPQASNQTMPCENETAIIESGSGSAQEANPHQSPGY